MASAGDDDLRVGVDNPFMPTTQHFVCKTCDLDFDSPAGLGQHVAISHGECAVCGEVHEDDDSLDEHTQRAH